MNSLTVFTGTEGWTASTNGARAIIAAGTNAPAGSKGNLMRVATAPGYDEVAFSNRYPSGSELATYSAPIMLAAPGRFSTTMLRPHISLRPLATPRLRMSAEPPAANGTTIVTFLAGYGTSAAWPCANAHAVAATATTFDEMVFRLTWSSCSPVTGDR